MSDEDRAIWNAAYSVAFVSYFDMMYAHTGNFDKSLEVVNAERAIDIANHAVRRLREWRDNEDPYAGIKVPLTEIP